MKVLIISYEPPPYPEAIVYKNRNFQECSDLLVSKPHEAFGDCLVLAPDQVVDLCRNLTFSLKFLTQLRLHRLTRRIPYRLETSIYAVLADYAVSKLRDERDKQRDPVFAADWEEDEDDEEDLDSDDGNDEIDEDTEDDETGEEDTQEEEVEEYTQSQDTSRISLAEELYISACFQLNLPIGSGRTN